MKYLKLTTICLHISAVLYTILGLLLCTFGILVLTSSTNYPVEESIELCCVFLFLGMLTFALATGVEIVIYHLKRKKFWAWIVAIMISAVYIPSIFMPLGAVSLYGLLSKKVRREFVKGA